MRYKKFIKKFVMIVVFVVSPFCNASLDEFMGSWVSVPYGEFEDIEVCFNETTVEYKWIRTGEVMSSGVSNITIAEDVLIMSFYLEGAILRKIVLLSRDFGEADLVGRIHMYTAGQAFNFYPIYLEKSPEKCRIDELPINSAN